MQSNNQYCINVFALNLEYLFEYNFKFDEEDTSGCLFFSYLSQFFLTLYTTDGRFEHFFQVRDDFPREVAWAGFVGDHHRFFQYTCVCLR